MSANFTALIADIQAAIRTLVAARAFSAVAVGTLSAGFALAVLVVSVVNAYVVRGMPYPAPDRLYRVEYSAPNEQPPRGLEQLDWAALNDVVEHPIAWDLDVFYLLGSDYPESAPGGWVTPGYISGFGVRAAVGRTFDARDFARASPAVAMISHRLWRTRFAGDQEIVGRTFQAYVSDRPDEPEVFTIVGVLPEDAWHFNAYTDILAPLRTTTYPYWLRLRTGVSPTVAAGRIHALVRQGIPEVPSTFGVTLTSARDSYVATVRPVLWSVAAAVALVLLIAAANVTVLSIVRARRRERELAVRVALGGSHRRVARLVALEGLVLGAVSAVIGLSAAYLALPALAPIVERAMDRRVPGGVAAVNVDVWVITATVLCAAIIMFVLALVPWLCLRLDKAAPHLAGCARGITDTRRARRTRASLIAFEVAASLTLVVGASLMGETAVRMLRVDFGLQADDVVTASLALRQQTFPDVEARAAFYERLLERLQGIGGAGSLALGDWWPLQGSRPRRVASGSAEATANPFAVTHTYFDTVRLPMKDGRSFTPHDRLGSAPAVIVSDSLARTLWPGESAVGRTLTMQADGEAAAETYNVLGVVADVRQSHADTDLADLYLPLLQHPGRFAFVYLQGQRSPQWSAELRAAVASVSREVAVGTPRALLLGLEQERVRPRFLASMLSAFAVLASGLALIGMHGVIAYAARQRQREIAVRIAIGASTGSVVTMFLREGMPVLGAGLVAGVFGALALGRVVESQLFGVDATQPRVLMGAMLLLAAAGLVAMVWPAWRAADTDPARILNAG